jgi:uncharacterized membrane protein
MIQDPPNARPGWAPPTVPGATAAPAASDQATTPLPRGGCLIAIRFDDPLYAQEAMLAAVRLRTRGHMTIDDAAIVSRVGEGKVRIQQTRDLNPVDGAMSGGWWGLLAGLFVGGPAIIVTGALGAAIGGLWAKLRDVGISDEEMRRLGESLEGEEAALFLLLEGAHRWHAMAEARRFPGRILHTTLKPDDEAELAAALGADVTTF